MTNIIGQILVLISTALVIYVNYLATTGAIGGITPSYISDKYPTYLTPAGYAFTIWGLIYLGIIAFSIFQLIRSESIKLPAIRSLFILSCVANISWIFAWHNRYLGLSVVAMFVLLGSLILINLQTWNMTDRAELLLIKAPFSVYFGWVSIATVLNVSIYVISLGFTAGHLASTAIACGLLAVVTLAGIVIREKLNVSLYPLTLAWAITAIAVKQGGKTAVIFACAIAVIALLISTLTFVLKGAKPNAKR